MGRTKKQDLTNVSPEKIELIKKINTVYLHHIDLTKYSAEELEKHFNLITKEKEGK